MGILEVLYLIELLYFMNAAADCSVATCSKDGIPVRFPFQLQGQQPQNSGYPGFDLSCNDQCMTVLQVPYSGDFLVRNINYLTQQIRLYDSDNCLPKRLLHLNLSSSPFAAVFYQNYTFLSCPTQIVKSGFVTIDCLRNSSRSILATSSMKLVTELSLACDAIFTLPIPVSTPSQYDVGSSSELHGDLLLKWSSPNCKNCEAQGGTCGFQGNGSQEIGCSDDSETGHSASALRVYKIISFSIGIPILTFATAVAVCACFMLRPGQGNRRNTMQRNPTTATAVQQPNILVTGLDESTIESFEEVVLGESKRLHCSEETTCAICLSEYNSKETLRCVPQCNHCFHADCIHVWLRVNRTCPVCRKSPSHYHAIQSNV